VAGVIGCPYRFPTCSVACFAHMVSVLQRTAGFFDVPAICRMPSALTPFHQLACALGGYNLKLSCCLGCDPRAVALCMVDT